MKRISSIHLKNYKAFRDQTFDLGGKNVLVYGNNGSGKSSLYWALYTFLQSSVKSKAAVQRYFVSFNDGDPNTFQSLKNVFADDMEDAFIKLTWIDETGTLTEKCISQTLINTNDPITREVNLTSDFINYKLLQNFYNGTHKQEVNLWDVFMRDVFPYFSKDNRSYKSVLNELMNDVPRRFGGRRASGKARLAYDEKILSVNAEIDLFLNQIEQNANQFLTNHCFAGKETVKVFLRYKGRLEYNNVRDKNFNHLHIQLWVEVFDDESEAFIRNYRPQSFLNEAQLTRVATAVRIGALRTRVQTSDFKVLCLDDMLISLDMSNRDEVIKLILNHENKPDLSYFDDFQKIILTHDKAFFNQVKRYTSPLQWKYFVLNRDESTTQPPVVDPFQGHLEKARLHFDVFDYESSGNALRQEVEQLFKGHKFKDRAESKYEGLKKVLKEMRNNMSEDFRKEYDKMFKLRNGLPIDLVKKLDTDFESDGTLSVGQINQLKAKKRELSNFFIKQYEALDEGEKLITKAEFILDFILNPTSHDTTNPNYRSEMAEAIQVVDTLRSFVQKSRMAIPNP